MLTGIYIKLLGRETGTAQSVTEDSTLKKKKKDKKII